MLESEGIHMVTLYDLQEILNHKELWEDEQEHKYIIKRVEAAKNHSLPRSIIEEVFPFGHNNNRLNTLKTVMENEVLLKYPTPIPIAPLEELTTQEMREYVILLDDALLNQCRMVTESIYGIGPDNEDYNMVISEFVNKLRNNSRLEVGFAVVLLGWIAFTILGAFIVARDNIQYWITISAVAIMLFFIVLMVVGKTRPKYFTINNKYKPQI